MGEKILYYLGAGASAKALPLARSVAGKITEEISTLPFIIAPKPKIPGLAYELETFSENEIFNEMATIDEAEFINRIKEASKELAKKATEFGDVDTYAKYLHLMHPGGEDFQNLKQTLSQYFSIKQLLLNARDDRYLPWLVSIMTTRVFPEHVKVLSWNYDFQVELAASQIGEGEDIDHYGTGYTYSPSMLSYYPNLDPSFSDYDRLSLIHLNGIAGYAGNNLQSLGSVFQNRHKKSKDSILPFLANNSLHRMLHFAWEGGNYHSTLMQRVEKIIADTSILVIIGYSFPFFNREIDKKVFNLLKGQAKPFRKIYYQDPVLDGQQLKAQFGLSPDFDIQHIPQTDNFHIPFEY